MTTLTRMEWCERRWSPKQSTGNFCNFSHYDDRYEKAVVFRNQGGWKYVINFEDRAPLWSARRWVTPESAILAVADKLVEMKRIVFAAAAKRLSDLTALELRRIIKQNHPDTAEQYDLALYQQAVEELQRRRAAA